MVWNAPFCMCAIRRVNEAHSKLQLNRFCLKKIIILFWSNEQYMQRTTGGAAGNSLYTTIKYMRGAAGIVMGTTIKYLVNQNAGAGNSWAKAHMHKAWNEFRHISLWCSGF